MPESSTRLDLPFIQAAQAQKHVTHNEALLRLDLLVQLVVEGFGALTPPTLAAEGQVWALGPAPSGAWAGQGGKLAAFVEGGWLFLTPGEGWLATSRAGEIRRWNASAWVAPLLAELNLSSLGINATPDATNALALSAPAALFTHAGHGHQIKINKASAGDTASLLYQTGFSGRAEVGLAGNDDLSIKVSADGTTWAEALRIDRATARPDFPQGLSAASLSGDALTQTARDATPGRLLKVGDSATLLAASPALRVLAGGSADALTLTTGAGFAPPPTGLALRFRANAANTGAATLALDGGAGVACRTVTGAVLPAGYIRTDADTLALFDGSFWVLTRASERGSNADGSYLRLQDGSLSCSRDCAVDHASAGVQDFAWPAAFVAAPVAAIRFAATSDAAWIDRYAACLAGASASHAQVLIGTGGTGTETRTHTVSATGFWY